MPTYLYAVTRADHPLDIEGLRGVGEPAVPLRAVRSDRVAAVVSDAPEGLRAKRRDLLAHQSVLERLLTDGAALPMRFGLIGPGDEEVLTVLRERTDAYTERLQDLDGCVEYNLKASREEDDLLREIVAGSEEIRELSVRTRDVPDARQERMVLGELIAAEVTAGEERERRDLTARLTPVALRNAPDEPVRGHFLNVSFLVGRSEAHAFSEAVHSEAERLGGAYALNLNGPLPPYSFV